MTFFENYFQNRSTNKKQNQIDWLIRQWIRFTLTVSKTSTLIPYLWRNKSETLFHPVNHWPLSYAKSYTKSYLCKRMRDKLKLTWTLYSQQKPIIVKWLDVLIGVLVKRSNVIRVKNNSNSRVRCWKPFIFLDKMVNVSQVVIITWFLIFE